MINYEDVDDGGYFGRRFRPAPTGTGHVTKSAPSAPSAPPVAAPSITPSYLSQMFGGALPEATASQITGLPAINPEQVNLDLSGQGFMANIVQQMLPQFAQQNLGLDEALANAGIMGGSSVAAQTNQGTSQQNALLAAIAPYLQTANAQQLQQAQGNQSADLQGQEANQRAALQAAGDNQAANNATNQFNVSNAIQAANTDSSTYNQFQQWLLSQQQGDYLQKLQNAYGLAQGRTAGQTGAYQPVFQQPSSGGGGFGQLASGIASAFQPTARESTPVTSYPQSNSNGMTFT